MLCSAGGAGWGVPACVPRRSFGGVRAASRKASAAGGPLEAEDKYTRKPFCRMRGLAPAPLFLLAGTWCSGNMPALGAGDPGFKPRCPPLFLIFCASRYKIGVSGTKLKLDRVLRTWRPRCRWPRALSSCPRSRLGECRTPPCQNLRCASFPRSGRFR
jgi:hypothetical protein